jgi:hypothetical protein
MALSRVLAAAGGRLTRLCRDERLHRSRRGKGCFEGQELMESPMTSSDRTVCRPRQRTDPHHSGHEPSAAAALSRLHEARLLLAPDPSHWSLPARQQLGVQLATAYQQLGGRRSGGYGQRVVAELARELDVGPDLVRKVMRFAALFSAEAATELSETHLTGGTKLTWSHVRHLLEVNAAAERQELLDMTVQHAWPSAQLAAEIQRRRGGKRSQGGRRRSAASTADVLAVPLAPTSLAQTLPVPVGDSPEDAGTQRGPGASDCPVPSPPPAPVTLRCDASP